MHIRACRPTPAFPSRPFAAWLVLAWLVACLLASGYPASAIAQAGGCPATPGDPPCPEGGPASRADPASVNIAIGNPVHALSGAKAQTDVDAAPEPGALGLEIRRHYTSGYASVHGPFGAGWTLSYDTRLFRIGRTAQIIQADGRRVMFRISGRDDAPICSPERPEDGALEVLTDRDPSSSKSGRAGNGQAGPAGRQAAVPPIRGYRWRWPDQREIDFDADGRLVRIRQPGPDGSLRMLSVERNVAGLITRVVDPQGRAMRIDHDANGRVTRIDHPRGRWQYRVDGAGAMRTVIAPNGAVRHYDYADAGHPFRLTAIRMSESTSSRGVQVAAWVYGPDGRVTESVAADGRRIRFEYGGAEQGSTRVVDADGRWTRYQHQTIAGRLRPVAVESAPCEACAADHRSLVYDAAGRLVHTQWRPADGAPSANRGSSSGPSTSPGPRPSTLRFERDAHGRVVRIEAPGAQRSDPPRWIRRFEYAEGHDSRPNLIARPSVREGQEHQLRLTWGSTAALRNRLVQVDESGFRDDEPITRTVHYRHDEQGRLVAIDGPLPGDADTYQVRYDPAQPGRMIGLQDPVGRDVRPNGAATPAWLQPPAWADIRGGADPDPARFQVSSGELTYRAGNGAVTRIRVDDFGRTIRIESADAGVERIVHDAADRVILNTDATGASVSLRHDAAGRPLERIVRAPGAEPEVTRYRYEAERTVIEHPVASESLQHDSAGRLIERSVIVHVGPAAGLRLGRRYHYAGTDRRPTAIELADGTRLESDIGARSAVRWTGHGSSKPIELWTRQPTEHGSRWTLGNGMTRDVTQDSRRRLTGIVDRRGDAVVHQRVLTYDERGRIAEITDPGGVWAFAYDRLGRLIVAKDLRAAQTAPADAKDTSAAQRDEASYSAEARASWWYAHDANGNRLIIKPLGQDLAGTRDAPTRFRVDPANDVPGDRVITLAYQPGSDRLLGPSFDAAGRPLRWRGFDLTWHAGGRIGSVSREGQAVARYFYNHRGERVAKQVGSDWTYFDHDDGKLVAEVRVADGRSDDSRMRHFIYDGERPSVMIDAVPAPGGLVGRLSSTWRSWVGQGDQVRWLHADHRGAPVATSDAQGKLVWSIHLTPDGAWQHTTLGKAADDPRIRLPGQYHDAETGLHDNIHRSYDPTLGRYLTPDPLGLRAGSNPYLYAGGDPINRVDPTGLLLFAFDGTGTTEDDSTNVWLMREYYAQQAGEPGRDRGPGRYYEPGVGTTGSWLAQRVQRITADEWRVAVDRQFTNFQKAAAALQPGENLFIDVVGFSRGAVQARAFGRLVAQALRDGTIPNAGQVTMRFMGLYDAVATNMFDGMSAQAVNCMIGIDREWQRVVHLVAINEYRSGFRPLLLPPASAGSGVRREIALVGAHSDIGGGYNGEKFPAGAAAVGRSDLSDIALWVMMEEARQAGVRLDPLKDQHLQVSDPYLNDQTTGSGGDPYRFVEINGQLRPLSDLPIGGVTRADSIRVGAPGSRLPVWSGSASLPPNAGPYIVGRINVEAYCQRLIESATLRTCP